MSGMTGAGEARGKEERKLGESIFRRDEQRTEAQGIFPSF